MQVVGQLSFNNVCVVGVPAADSMPSWGLCVSLQVRQFAVLATSRKSEVWTGYVLGEWH